MGLVPMATVSSDRRRALAALVRERDAERSSARTLGRAAGALLILVLLSLGGLWLAGFFSLDPDVREIRGLVDEQIVELQRVARNEVPLSYESPGFGAVLDRVRDLPPEVRRAAGREVGRLFEARERAEMESFFNMPPERRQAELDRRIQAEEARRKAREAERARRTAERPAQAGPQAGGGGGGPPGAPPGRRGRSSTEDERNARSKASIDRSSPAARARRTEYRRAMDERRTQLGLPAQGGRR